MKIKLFIFGWLFVINGCKYENGPLFSLWSEDLRVIGDYIVESATENGVDMMSSVNALKIEALHFHSDDNLSDEGYNFSVSFSDTSFYHDGRWNVLNNGYDIFIENLGCYSSAAIPPPFAPVPGFLSNGSCNESLPIWEIIKLSNSTMWLRMTFNGKTYEVHLKQIK